MNHRFQIDARPVANAESIIAGDRWRITVLTDGLVRLEWSNDGEFEDRASTFAWFRDLPTPPFEVSDKPNAIEVSTSRFHLRYNRQEFSPHGLTIRAKGRLSNHRATWRYGTDPEPLGGTARTLDTIDGRVDLEPGITSRHGIGVVDDSDSFLFTNDGWIASRSQGDNKDIYVFAYGHDYVEAIKALYAVAGPQPLLPRWALGNWWSRYLPYSEDSYLELVDRFTDEGLPLSVGVIDMDWHRVSSIPEEYGTGWTGYSWEPSLFPEPERFLGALHDRGLRTTLNVHPHEGVRPYEDAYADMCEALGRDPELGETIEFDPTDREFLDAYFDVLHRGLEDQGVDFWWIDWQQGRTSSVPGVDPLWMLNHYHFLDSTRDSKRPLAFSRYAGPGSHRYPVGFSGDTVITWDSLHFQPEFTAAASDIGYGWWSHDIGGHLWGVRDDDLTVRWLQYGVFSPINRLHSSNNPFLIKEPWMYPLEARTAMGEALRLRNRLVPYVHTMNHRAAREGRPLVSPMYHLYPNDDRAYRYPNQYGFGHTLMVAPITKPRSATTLLGSVEAWVPEGTWVDVFTDAVYQGDTVVTMHRGWGSIPVLMPSGAMLPLAAEAMEPAASNPEHIEVLVVPGTDGRLELYEDDGTGSTIDEVPTAITELVWQQLGPGRATLEIHPRRGAPIEPDHRTWTVTIIGGATVESAAVPGRGPMAVTHKDGRASVTVDRIGPDEGVSIELEGRLTPEPQAPNDRALEILNNAQVAYEAKLDAWRVVESNSTRAEQIAAIASLELHPDLVSALTEVFSTAR